MLSARFKEGDEAICVVLRYNHETGGNRPTRQRARIVNRRHHRAEPWFPRGGWWYHLRYVSKRGKVVGLSRHEDDLEAQDVSQDGTDT